MKKILKNLLFVVAGMSACLTLTVAANGETPPPQATVETGLCNASPGRATGGRSARGSWSVP